MAHLETVDYYNNNAPSYIERTVEFDMEDHYKRFLTYLPEGGLILDAGCGSGRDTQSFLKRGMRVKAIDASTSMIAHLKKQIPEVDAEVKTFDEITFDECFDGIWCSASLLHVPKEELDTVMERMKKALKPGGVWFISFKEGSGEKIENGRYFLFMNLDELKPYVKGYTILDSWSRYSESNLVPTTWLNIIVQKPY